MTFDELVEEASFYCGGIDIDVDEVLEAVQNIAPVFVESGQNFDENYAQDGEHCLLLYKTEEPTKWLYDDELEAFYREYTCVAFDVNDDERDNVVNVMYFEKLEYVGDPKRVTPRDLIHDIDLGDWYEYEPRKK